LTLLVDELILLASRRDAALARQVRVHKSNTIPSNALMARIFPPEAGKDKSRSELYTLNLQPGAKYPDLYGKN
jgi:hypothetical protein